MPYRAPSLRVVTDVVFAAQCWNFGKYGASFAIRISDVADARNRMPRDHSVVTPCQRLMFNTPKYFRPGNQCVRF
jgi:hypothetical protein